MAYQKTVWKDQDVENPRTYVMRDNGDDTVTLLDAFGTVTELGTPVNAANMNKIENGIEEVEALANTKATSNDISNAINSLLSALYPVGSLYITTQYTGSSNFCPIASLINGSQWELVAQDRALWGGNGPNANTTIAAGLPNITGEFSGRCLINNSTSTNGAFYQTSTYRTQLAGGSDSNHDRTFAFDASRSNSIYGSSSTVQPPAYRVNVWRRTA